MAKNNQFKKIINTWWGQAILALIATSLVYRNSLFAIDSGSLLEYAATIFFLILAINFAANAVRYRLTK